MESIAEKIIKPVNCLLAISLPLTKNEFLFDLKNGNKDYARSRKSKYKFRDDALWEVDHLPFIKLYEKIKNKLIKTGLNVKENFKISDLKNIDKYDVTTFITHSIVNNKQIEFHDGLFYDYEFVNYLPVDFNKILDLTICNSTFLQDPIKNKYKECIVFANKNHTNLDFRLILYFSLMKLLHKRDLNYIDAFTELRISLLT